MIPKNNSGQYDASLKGPWVCCWVYIGVCLQSHFRVKPTCNWNWVEFWPKFLRGNFIGPNIFVDTNKLIKLCCWSIEYFYFGVKTKGETFTWQSSLALLSPTCSKQINTQWFWTWTRSSICLELEEAQEVNARSRQVFNPSEKVYDSRRRSGGPKGVLQDDAAKISTHRWRSNYIGRKAEPTKHKKRFTLVIMRRY